jgi:phage gpG-like protein
MSFSEKIGDSTISGDFSKLDKLVKNLKSNYYVDIGILGAQSSTEGGLTIAGIGAVHEFGTDKAGRGNKTKIPERSFIRMPLEVKQSEITKAVEKRLEQLLGEGDIEGIFRLIGIAGEAQIQEAFDSQGFGNWEPNAESTATQKGSATPLIDDGTLRKSITSKTGKG